MIYTLKKEINQMLPLVEEVNIIYLVKNNHNLTIIMKFLIILTLKELMK